MSYKITFRDKHSVQLPTEKGERLKNLLLLKNPPANIEINGELYRASEIISITKNAESQADTPADFSRQLPPGRSRCRGQYSIQQQINQIIKADYPQDWTKRIRDKAFRETVRQQLRTQSPGPWCDYRAGECACEAEFAPSQGVVL